MNLDDRIALVTGAGRGIGKGCALALAQAGATLILNDRPASEDLATVAEEIESIGLARQAETGRPFTPAATIPADVFSRAGCEQLVEAALAAAGKIDILVSNPACSIRGDFLDYDPADFERVVQGTLISGFHMGQLVSRQMVRQANGGKIVFISSVQAEMPLARCIAYSAAKAGLNHMARTMSVELSQYRINVNAIEPGWIDTPGEHESFSEEVIHEEGGKLPWQRLGTPADIGQAAAFLASDQADYITGSVLCVDGGFRFKDCRPAKQIPTRDKA